MAGLEDTFDPVNVSLDRMKEKEEEEERKRLLDELGNTPVAAAPAPSPEPEAEAPLEEAPVEDDVESAIAEMMSQETLEEEEEGVLAGGTPSEWAAYTDRLVAEGAPVGEVDSAIAEMMSQEDDVDSAISDMMGQGTEEDVAGPDVIDDFTVSEKGIQYSGLQAVDSILQRFDKGSLTKEVATADPEVMDMVRAGLEFRYGDRGILRRTAGALASGIGTNYTDDMSDEEAYEMWQNWMRSFSGGQTSTMASEAIFIASSDDKEKAFLGAQYLLFDKHPDIFSSEVSYSEMFDGLYDYTKAALYDATTVASVGIGRAFTLGGAKGAAMGVRQTMQAVLVTELQKGVTQQVAQQAARAAGRQALGGVVKGAAAYSAFDLAANVGADIWQQDILIDTGAQEKYSALRTGVAAMATMAIPAAMATSSAFSAFLRSPKAPASMRPAVNIADKFQGMTKEVIDKQMYARINWDMVESQFKETIQDFSENRGLYQKWSDALIDAKSIIGEGISLTDNEKIFMRGFMFGPTDGKTKGFVQTMEEAGLVQLKRDADDNVTNFIGDAMSWLQEAEVSGYVDAFVKNFDDFPITPLQVGKGDTISNISGIRTGKELAAFWRRRQSEVGARLWDSSEVKRMLSRRGRRTGPAGEGESTATDLMDAMLGEVGKEVPKKQRGAYTASLWKSTVTATLATTGTNVRGWAGFVALNTTADLVDGALNIGLSGMQRAIGSNDAAKITMQIGQSSILGALRRGVGFLGASDTLESATGFLKLNPKIQKALSRDMTGDAGAVSGRDTLELFGLNPNDKLNLGLESVRHGVQVVSGVKLQDELTKKLSLMTNIEQYIYKYYGVSYNRFMEDPKLGFIEMQSTKYHDTVVRDALDRTMRETGTKVWSGKEGSNIPLSTARGIEAVSRNAAGAYVIPFGKWFNTATSMVGDFSGANLVRYTVGKLKGDTSTGLSSEALTTLTSKAAVAWGGIFYLSSEKEDNIRKGLSATMVRQDDGSIRDVSMDFPENIMHVLAQAVAHKRTDGRVPKDVMAEAGDIILNNFTKTGSDLFKIVLDTISGENSVSELANYVGNGTIKTMVGFTRPLDPINSLIKMVEQDFDEPDRKVSGDKWVDWSMVKNATRYTDQFFELLGLGPTEATPKASMGIQTYGSSPVEASLLFGARRPGGLSMSRKMINSVGRADWATFRWGGDPVLKNWMNSRMENIFEAQAHELFRNRPDFFDLPLTARESLLDGMLVQSKEMLRTYLEVAGPPEMGYRRRLDKVNKEHLAEVMRSMNIEGNALDLLKEEDGLDMLNVVLTMAETAGERSTAR